MEEGINKSKKLINDFVKEYLNGDINELKNFSFLNLNTDTRYHEIDIKADDIKKYGGYFHKKGGSFTLHPDENDYDDMNLARAIYYLLFHCKQNLPELYWKDLTWEYQKVQPMYSEYNYRGETINTFSTLIDEKNYKDFFKTIPNCEILIAKIEKFLYKVFSIGNFMLLPNKKVGAKSLNTYKGSCLGDYSDLFLKSIINANNCYIEKLKEKNKFYFSMGIDNIIEKNYLQIYVDKNRVKYNFNPHYKYCFFDKATDTEEKEIYAEFIEKYINEVSKYIDARANIMIEDLKELL